MEIDITSLVSDMAPRDYSASCLEFGQDAGSITWRHALQDAPIYPLLDTAEKRDAFRAYVLQSGGWDETRIAEFSDAELSALFLQWIAGDFREMLPDYPCAIPADIPWAEIEARQSTGQCPSNIFRGIDGKIYFSLEY